MLTWRQMLNMILQPLIFLLLSLSGCINRFENVTGELLEDETRFSIVRVDFFSFKARTFMNGRLKTISLDSSAFEIIQIIFIFSNMATFFLQQLCCLINTGRHFFVNLRLKIATLRSFPHSSEVKIFREMDSLAMTIKNNLVIVNHRPSIRTLSFSRHHTGILVLRSSTKSIDMLICRFFHFFFHL